MFCCRRSRQDRALEKARDYLDKEVNIYKIIQMRRYLMDAIKTLLPRERRQELIKKARYKVIEIDPLTPELSEENLEDSFF